MTSPGIDHLRQEQAAARARYIIEHYITEHPNGVLHQHLQDERLTSEQAYVLLKEISRDPKTGLSRADLLSMTLGYELERAAETQQPLTVAVFDLDYFRKVNEQLTHVGADRILKQVGEILHEQIRTSDDVLQAEEMHDVVRWGGEEFVVIFPNTTIVAGAIAAERIRRAVHDLSVPSKLTHGSISISGGLAAAQTGDSWETILQRADAQVLRAKERGRNQICFPQ